MKTDTLWGIERFPKSQLEGKLVCPKIYLRKAPGALQVSEKVKHGTEVEITEELEQSGRMWYRVRTTGIFRKSGWVLESLLKEQGKVE